MALNFLLSHVLHSFRRACHAAAAAAATAAKGDIDNVNSSNYFLVTAAMALSTALLVVSHFLSKKKKTKRAPLPPGPTGLPVVGYLPFLGTHLHREFTALAATYGPIYSLRLGRKLCAVVSSSSLAREVVRDLDAVFANREPPISAMVLTYGGDDVAFSNYGPAWKKLRKVFVREMLGGASLEECYGLRKQQVRNSVKEVYQRSSSKEAMDFGEMAFKTTTNAMLSMLWGGVEAADDEGFYGEFRELESEMLVLMGTPNVSDFIPALARFDLQGIEKKSKRLLSKFDEILSSVIEERLRAVEKRGDTRRKDFLQVLLDLNRDGGSDGETYITTNQVKALLMDILVGGTDTTSTMIEWTMSELINHPDAMAKVYEELDLIVGRNDVVEESHLPKLTYLEAVIKETFRLHPALPLLVPRCPSETCQLGGYTIPKGTIVYLNAYALHTDPELWVDPLEFKPDRFIDENEVRFDFQGNNFQFLPFGSGRRVCPGQPLGVNTQKYVLATLLHSFEWKLPAGEEMEMEDKFGIVIKKMNPLVVVPTPRLSNLELY